jgi:hypothetical protein
MIPGSVKIYAKINKLEPTTRNNLDWFGFGYFGKHVIHVPLKQDANVRCKDHLNEIEPIQINLNWAKECYMNLNIK